MLFHYMRNLQILQAEKFILLRNFPLFGVKIWIFGLFKNILFIYRYPKRASIRKDARRGK